MANLLWHRLNGKWRVIYPSGEKSQPFTKRVAKDYRDIFGGVIERVPNKTPNLFGRLKNFNYICKTK